MAWIVVPAAVIGLAALIVGIANGDWWTAGIGAVVLALAAAELSARRRGQTVLGRRR
jgi:hypothetical protein